VGRGNTGTRPGNYKEWQRPLRSALKRKKKGGGCGTVEKKGTSEGCWFEPHRKERNGAHSAHYRRNEKKTLFPLDENPRKEGQLNHRHQKTADDLKKEGKGKIVLASYSKSLGGKKEGLSLSRQSSKKRGKRGNLSSYATRKAKSARSSPTMVWRGEEKRKEGRRPAPKSATRKEEEGNGLSLRSERAKKKRAYLLC